MTTRPSMKSRFPDFVLIPGVGKATPTLVSYSASTRDAAQPVIDLIARFSL